YVRSSAAVQIGEVGAVGNHTAILHPKTLRVHRRESLFCSELQHSCSMSKHNGVRHHGQSTRLYFLGSLKCAFEIVRPSHLEGLKLNSQRLSRDLCLFKTRYGCRVLWIPDYSEARPTGDRVF